MNTLESLRRLTVALVALAPLAPAVAFAGFLVAERPSAEGGYRLESVLGIGGAEAEDDSFFYEKFGSIRVDSDGNGNIYVLDSGNVRIQVFDSQGRFLRSLGSEGEGPGEFQIMGRFSVNREGSVAVFDMGQGRVSVLDPEGNLLRDVVIGGSIKDLCLADDGTLYLGYGSRGPAAVVAYDANGVQLWKAGSNTPEGGMVVEIEIGSQTVAPRLEMLSNGRIFRTPKGEYLVQSFSSGKELVSFKRPFDRREVSPEEMFPPSDGEEGSPQVVMIKREVGGPQGGGGGRASTSDEEGWHGESTETFDTARLRQFLPKHHPDTRGVLAWPDGRLWVLTAEDRRGDMVTDEWSSDGKYLRRFTIPGEYDWLNLGSDGNLYGVTHDEDDYPTAHRIEVKKEA